MKALGALARTVLDIKTSIILSIWTRKSAEDPFTAATEKLKKRPS